MQNLRLFGAAVRVVGMGFLTGSLGFIGIPACAQRVPNQPSASSRSEVHPPQPEKPARCVSDCAKPSLDAGAVGGNEAPQTAAVASVEFNFAALEARILNPYDAKATVSSPPPTHHVTANFDEDLSLDLVNMAGSVGREVWFKAEALTPATAVRGRVLRGGKNARQPICGRWSDGGGGLQVGIEVLHDGTWKSVGWVLYGHVQDMTVDDGDVIESPTSVARVTALRDNVYCSTGGHLHLGFSDSAHHPCWAVARRVLTDGPVAQVGGSRESLSKCSM